MYSDMLVYYMSTHSETTGLVHTWFSEVGHAFYIFSHIPNLYNSLSSYPTYIGCTFIYLWQHQEWFGGSITCICTTWGYFVEMFRSKQDRCRHRFHCRWKVNIVWECYVRKSAWGLLQNQPTAYSYYAALPSVLGFQVSAGWLLKTLLKQFDQ